MVPCTHSLPSQPRPWPLDSQPGKPLIPLVPNIPSRIYTYKRYKLSLDHITSWRLCRLHILVTSRAFPLPWTLCMVSLPPHSGKKSCLTSHMYTHEEEKPADILLISPALKLKLVSLLLFSFLIYSFILISLLLFLSLLYPIFYTYLLCLSFCTTFIYSPNFSLPPLQEK